MPQKKFRGHSRFKKVCPLKNSGAQGGAIRVLAMPPPKKMSILCQILFLSSAMPPKDLAPFSYIFLQKNLLLMIKYELSTSCRWCSKQVVHLLGTAKKWPSHEPCCAPPQKLLLLM